MKTRALILSAALILLVGSSGAATFYRIVVDGQGEILTSTAPVTFGSMVLVRRADGTLTTIPSNLVRSVSTATRARSLATSLASSARLVSSTASSKPIEIGTLRGAALAGSPATARAGSTAPTAMAATSALAPGQTIFLGQTGSATTVAVVSDRAATAAGDTVVVSAWTGDGLAQAATAPMFSANPQAASIERQVFQSDLARDTARTGPTVDTNATPNGDFIIGPNGFPLPITVGASTPTAQTVIGPNGFPVPVTADTAAAQTLIGPNGFPVPIPTAQTAAPVIGSNGFPVLGTTSGTLVQTAPTRGVATVPSTASPGTAGALGVPATGTSVVSTTTAAPGSPQ